MQAFLHKTWRASLLIITSTVLLLWLVWYTVYRQLKEDKIQSIEAAMQRNANLAVALEQYALRTIHNGEVILQLVKKAQAEKGYTIDLKELVASNIIDTVICSAVYIVDKNGKVMAANVDFANPTFINVPGASNFEYHTYNLNKGLHIGLPVLSAISGKAVVPLSVRLNNRDGSFFGAAFVEIEPAVFTRFYSRANMKSQDIISLVSPEGITYSRRKGAIESYGENIRKSPLYVHLKKARVNNYFAKDAIHGIPTYFSYRRLANYPVIATVGASEEDVLASYFKKTRRDVAFATVFSGMIILFSALIALVLWHRKKNAEQIRTSEVKYRSIFENSSDSILLMTAAGKIVAANKAACIFFGLSKEEMFNRTAVQLTDSTDPAFMQLVDEGKMQGTAKGELQFLHSNGSLLIGEVTSAKYEDADGGLLCIIIIRNTTDKVRLQKKLVAEQKRYQKRVTQQVIQAQEKEREVIGRELHDNVNQVLTTVKLYLEMAFNHKDLREELIPKSMAYITQSINEIRNLSRDLSAPTLGTKSLIDSLQALVEMVQTSSGLHIRFVHEDYCDNLSMDQQLAIYRIVQEQLNNVIKHANAKTVHLSIGQANGRIELIINDDGKGFDTLAKRSGIGLNNIASRVRVFDGETIIESAVGRGCSLIVRLPLLCTINDNNFQQLQRIV